jgi:hypothetical protein
MKNFYFSSEPKYLKRKKDINLDFDKSRRESININMNSPNSSNFIFENLNDKSVKKINCDIASKFYQSKENFFNNKQSSPKINSIYTKSEKNNLNKFLFEPKYNKINKINNNSFNIYERTKFKINRNKNNKFEARSTLNYSNNSNFNNIIDVNNPKIILKINNNKLNNSSFRYTTSNETNNNNRSGNNNNYNHNKNNNNKNISININNKITNFYDLSGFMNNNKDNSNIKNNNNNINNNEEEIAQKLHLYKSKLNSELIKVINEEKMREIDRLCNYERSENLKEKKKLEKEISKKRIFSSERIIKINE